MTGGAVLDKFLRRWAPPAWVRGPDAEYAKTVFWMMVGTVLVSLAVSAEHWVVYRDPYSSISLAVSGIAVAMQIACLRWMGGPKRATTILAATIWVTLFAVSYSRGGFHMMIQLWNTLLPLAAISLGRHRWAARWTALIILQVIVLVVLERLQLAPPRLDPSPMVEVVAAVAWLSFVVWVLRKLDEGTAGMLARRERLKQANLEAVSRLAGGVAHDFGNVLSVVMSHAEAALQDSPGDPTLTADLSAILNAARGGKGLAKQLMDLSRDDQHNPSTLELQPVVQGAAQTLKRLLPKGMELLVDLDDAPCLARADRAQLQRVLLNLALNSRDAMPNGGQLTLGAYSISLREQLPASPDDVSAGDWSVLEVSDTGSGMDRETAMRMFDPFFTTKGPQKGNGLGLSNVRAMVNRLHGRIGVWTYPGEGTTLRMFFPVPTTQATTVTVPLAAALNPGPLPGHRSASRRLLVVDDDDRVLRSTCRLLRAAGFETISAGSGEDAFALFQAGEKFDTLVTDLLMPGMHGEELAQRVADMHVTVGVVFVSGQADSIDGPPQVQGLRSLALTKPFERNELVQAIREVTRPSTLPPPAFH